MHRTTRSGNLDLLRAAAIVGVLVYHVVNRWPTPLDWVKPVANIGSRGVDLFFVLSGFLIGGLVWRELKDTGRLNIGHFLARRLSRTVPVYFAALAVAYAGVYVARREPFDWSYLLFLQNFGERLPFFQVSWSLCIEEHFYLFFPLLILLVRQRLRWILLACAAIVLGTVALRATATLYRPYGTFDFSVTATHYRLDGLTMGFALAALRAYSPFWFKRVVRVSPWIIILCGTAWAACVNGSVWSDYVLSVFFLSITFTAVLAWLVERPSVPGATSRPVYWIAVTSYSTYLVHSFGIDLSLRVINKLHTTNALVVAFVFALFVTAVSGLFFFAVERTTLLVRERLVPATGRPLPAREVPAVHVHSSTAG